MVSRAHVSGLFQLLCLDRPPIGICAELVTHVLGDRLSRSGSGQQLWSYKGE